MAEQTTPRIKTPKGTRPRGRRPGDKKRTRPLEGRNRPAKGFDSRTKEWIRER